MNETRLKFTSLKTFEPESFMFDSDSLRWRECDPTMKIVSHFDIMDWLEIMPFANSDEEVFNFLKAARDYAKMYVLEDVASRRFLGVCLLIVANTRKHTVNLHGGIIRQYYSPLKCSSGLLKMIDALIKSGWNVRSQSKTLRAYRFLKSIGFRICGYHNGLIYSYVTQNLMLMSPIYRRMSYPIEKAPRN